ncbi:MAG: caspase family protein [Myxococcales bacterium]|nr:caspase family protein [Myxococcales bacterium]
MWAAASFFSGVVALGQPSEGYLTEISPDGPVVQQLWDPPRKLRALRLPTAHPGGGPLQSEPGTLELWVRGTSGPLLSQGSRRAGALSVEAPAAEGWHHVALRWDADGDYTVVLDGREQPHGGTLAPRGTWWVGGRKGRVAAWAYYDRELSLGRIRSHLAVGNGRLSPTVDDVTLPVQLRPQSGGDVGLDAVLYSPDGRLALVRQRGSGIGVWDTHSGLMLRQWRRSMQIHDVVWSPEGRRIAMGTCLASEAGLCLQNQVEILDVQTGEVELTLSAFSDWIDRIRFSPDGTKLAVSSNYAMRVWSLVDGADLFEDQQLTSARLPALAWSPDGARLAIGGAEQAVIWDVATGQRIGTVAAPGDAALQPMVGGLRFVDDAEHLLLWGFEGARLVRTSDWADVWHRTESLVASATGPWEEHLHVVTQDGQLQTWSLADGAPVGEPFGSVAIDHTFYWRAHAVAPDGRHLAVADEGSVALFDALAGTARGKVDVPTEQILALDWSPDGDRLLVAGVEGEVHLLDVARAQVSSTSRAAVAVPVRVALTDDGSQLAVLATDAVRVFDLRRGEQIRSLEQPWDLGALDIDWVRLAFDGPEALVLTDLDAAQAVRWEASTGVWATEEALDAQAPQTVLDDDEEVLRAVRDGAVLWELDLREVGITADAGEDGTGQSYLQEAHLSDDGRRLFTASHRYRRGENYELGESFVQVWEVEGLVKRTELGPLASWVHRLHQPSEDVLLVHQWEPVGSGGHVLAVFDLRNGERLYDTSGVGEGTAVAFTPDGRTLAVATADGRVVVRDRDNDQQVAVVAGGSDWVMYQPDAVFAASGNGERLVAATQGTRAFGVDQLAATHNRPHVLMERLGSTEHAVRKHLEERFTSRLRRQGLQAQVVDTPLRRPTVEVVRVGPVARDGEVTLHLRAHAGRTSAGEGALTELQIYVQGVPVLDPPRPLQGADVRLTVPVQLTAGGNAVEVAVRDAAGVESLRSLTYVSHQPEVPVVPDLYFVGLGVSTYRDPDLDLAYAHKDALDLAAIMQTLPGYGAVHVRTFLDDAVTASVMDEVSQWVAGARPDDVFVLFVAGHGVHDQDGTYFYVTHDADLTDLASTAASFERLEALLVSIAPRQKLLLMDTCESGERDPDEVARGTPQVHGMISRGLDLSGADQGADEPSVAVDWDRFIYADLRRRSGTIVLSSSSGTEVSYESDRLRNGFFTHAVLRALRGEADADADGGVDTDELRTFVAATVREATRGAQNPRVDRDNLRSRIWFRTPAP